MQSEKILVATPSATVTDSRFITKEKTYLIAGVTSAHMAALPTGRRWALAAAVLGLMLVALGSLNYASLVWLVGLGLLAIAIPWLFSRKEYALVLTSSSGWQVDRALVSRKSAYIVQIVEAINQAIASQKENRGE